MQLTVLTDRSQGGSSLRDGSLELMVSGLSPHLSQDPSTSSLPALYRTSKPVSFARCTALFMVRAKLSPPFLCETFTPCFYPIPTQGSPPGPDLPYARPH